MFTFMDDAFSMLSQVLQYGCYCNYDHDGKVNQGITVIQEAIKNCFLIGNGSDIYRGRTKES